MQTTHPGARRGLCAALALPYVTNPPGALVKPAVVLGLQLPAPQGTGSWPATATSTPEIAAPTARLTAVTLS